MHGKIHIPGIRSCFHGFLILILFLLSGISSLNAQWLKSTHFEDSDMARDLAEALTFQKYPTYEQYLEMMQGFASSYPEICLLDTIGYSQEGRLLLALKISDDVEKDQAEASFLYSSTMHGDEILGYVLLLRLADTLLSGYGVDSEITKLVDELAIWINPLANPDASFHNDHNLSLQNAVRTALDGTDLNRDFPNPGASEPDDTTGRAPENRYMMEFLREKRFTMSANIHGGEEVVNYPWDHTSDLHADDDWFRFVSREYVDEAMAVDPDYMWGWPDGGITNGWAWYQALGTRQDYVNWYLGGREVTLELSMEKLLPSDELEQHWNLNRRSLINYMAQCLYGIQGRVWDKESGRSVGAKIRVANHDSTYSHVYSSEDYGVFFRPIKEGVYDLEVSAPGYHTRTISTVIVKDYQASVYFIELIPYETVIVPEEAPEINIYPNPAVHSFTIAPLNLPHGKLDLAIYRVDGKKIYREVHPYDGAAIRLSTSQLEEGIYLIRCVMGNYTITHRLVVFKP